MFAIGWEKIDDVAVITMDNGENLQSSGFIKGMLSILNEIEDDQSIASVIISSGDPKSWCQGVDLEFLMESLAKNDTRLVFDLLIGINKIFERLLLFSIPVVAAIGGHAVGNGAILACACDFRFMRSDRGYFFFPDADLGIPTLPGSMEICKKAIPFPVYQEMLFTGRRFIAKELYDNRVILKASDNLDSLMTDTLDFAKGINKQRTAFGEIKKRLYRGIVEVMDKEDPVYIETLMSALNRE